MLKEQILTPRAGRDSVAGSRERGAGSIVQRPAAKRGRGSGQSARHRQWTPSAIFSYVPLALKCLLAVLVGVLFFAAYRAASSTSFFQARSINIDGTRRASPEELRAIVRRAALPTGVWRADLERISAELQAQAWVRNAVVSRVLPSGLRVRVTEREPRAVVRTSGGRLVWVDADGVMVGTISSTDQTPPFFMRGWDEEKGELARKENRERVTKYLELVREWGDAGLANRVSEINLGDLRDVRVQLAGDDSQIEVRLGREDLSKRFKQALSVLDEQRQTPRGPYVTYLDLTQGTRAVIGSNIKAQSAATQHGGQHGGASNSDSDRGGEAKPSGAGATREAQRAEKNKHVASAAPATARNKEARTAKAAERPKNKDSQKRHTREQRVADKKPAATTGAERPRRVG